VSFVSRLFPPCLLPSFIYHFLVPVSVWLFRAVSSHFVFNRRSPSFDTTFCSSVHIGSPLLLLFLFNLSLFFRLLHCHHQWLAQPAGDGPLFSGDQFGSSHTANKKKKDETRKALKGARGSKEEGGRTGVDGVIRLNFCPRVHDNRRPGGGIVIVIFPFYFLYQCVCMCVSV